MKKIKLILLTLLTFAFSSTFAQKKRLVADSTARVLLRNKNVKQVIIINDSIAYVDSVPLVSKDVKARVIKKVSKEEQLLNDLKTFNSKEN